MAYNDPKKTFLTGTGTTPALAKTDFDTNFATLMNSATGPIEGVLGIAICNSGLTSLSDSQATAFSYTFWAQIQYSTKS